MEIRFFNQNVENFIAGLEESIIAKTLRTLDLLEKFGNNLGMPHSKKIGSNLFELRLRSKSEIRIIYCFYKNKTLLLHAFIKKTKKIPKRAISLAQNRLNSLADT